MDIIADFLDRVQAERLEEAKRTGAAIKPSTRAPFAMSSTTTPPFAPGATTGSKAPFPPGGSNPPVPPA